MTPVRQGTPGIVTARRVVFAAVLLGVAGAAGVLFFMVVSPTKIAFVNFQDFQYAEVLEMNSNPLIRTTRIALDDRRLNHLERYHVALIFGKGLRLTPEKERAVARAGLRGTKLFVFGGLTRDMDALTNLRGNDLDNVNRYLGYGGAANIRRLLAYCRRALHGRTMFSDDILPPRVVPVESYFHGGDDEYFETYDDYLRFYREKGFLKPGAPRVLILTSNLGPHSPATARPALALIKELERSGCNVFPTTGFFRRLDYIKEVRPDVIVFFAHGRIAPGKPDEAAMLLKEVNAPLLCPIVLFEPYDAWMKDKKGMAGGNLGQNIVVPEIDGGTVPYVIGAQFPDKRGLMVFREIPDRIVSFCQLVANTAGLRSKKNSEKRVAIFYYKGPGLNALTATGLNVTPSLLNLLKTLKAAGYATGELPETADELYERIQNEGRIIGSYAHGANDDFIKNGNPQLITADTLQSWMRTALPRALVASVEKKYGLFPGDNPFTTDSAGQPCVAFPRVRFGNVTLLPQLSSGSGDAAPGISGALKDPPPYSYIASYLWVRNGFKADALIHFGTYGNFEFLPSKQPPLSTLDWPDALFGSLPHLYIYCIESVGDALVAKRRSYATIISHLTPPFKKAGVYGDLRELKGKLEQLSLATSDALREQYRRTIGRLAFKTGIAKLPGMPPDSSLPFSDDQVRKVARHVDDVQQEQIHEGLYTLGTPYTSEQTAATCRAIFGDLLMYRMNRMDFAVKKGDCDTLDGRPVDERRHQRAADAMVDAILNGTKKPDACITSGDSLRLTLLEQQQSRTPEENELFGALDGYRSALNAILPFRNALDSSPVYEMRSILNGLSGGYIPPSSGGDPVVNPGVVPSGRNLYGVNAEQTPDEEACEVGAKLADQLCAQRRAATGNYPRKVAVTLWGGEFIRDRGATIAEIFALLGVRPMTNAMGVIYDVALIPCGELTRPRIDVVVQTSGQFRDVAASRVALIDKAIRLASDADDGPSCGNFVREGSLDMEKVLKEKGYSPADARELSRSRIFGGIDGHYGAGIRELVQSGDQWDATDELALRYIENMGALYTGDRWGDFKKGVFEAALRNTEVATQSVNSHLTTPLSLDNVYEFMGGVSAAVRMVTGKSPSMVFSDLRTPANPRVRDAGEMIWAEARSGIFNPAYIKPMLENGPSALESIAEHFRNSIGWNALTPQIVGNAYWEQVYNVYVRDDYNLHLQESFERQNPYAFQEMTAILLETVRKGYWNPGPAVTRQVAQLHARLVVDHKAGCGNYVCNNGKLRDMIRMNCDRSLEASYREKINNARLSSATNEKQAIVLKKEEQGFARRYLAENRQAIIILGIIIVICIVAVVGGTIRQQHRR